jgi:uncharacterized protein (DUF362 family)
MSRRSRVLPVGIADERVWVWRRAEHAGQTIKPLEILGNGLLPSLRVQGSNVLVKINLNTADPYPGSTSPEMLRDLLYTLKDHGCRDIRVGDCSSLASLPTRKVAHDTGILDEVRKVGARFVSFERCQWARVVIPGRHLTAVTVPRCALEAERIISLANLKSHRLADFSFGLKLAVGYLAPWERQALHQDHLAERCVEVNLAIPADATLIDGRIALITGGPDSGDGIETQTVIMGTDPLRVDLEAYRQLYAARKQHGQIGSFTEDPFQMAQFRHAALVFPNSPDRKGGRPE